MGSWPHNLPPVSLEWGFGSRALNLSEKVVVYCSDVAGIFVLSLLVALRKPNSTVGCGIVLRGNSGFGAAHSFVPAALVDVHILSPNSN